MDIGKNGFTFDNGLYKSYIPYMNISLLSWKPRTTTSPAVLEVSDGENDWVIMSGSDAEVSDMFGRIREAMEIA